MDPHYTRREALALAAGAVLGGTCGFGIAADAPRPTGVVAGHAEGAKAGRELLDAGGNAVDAVVAAGLAVAVAAPQLCGLGGYGGHLIAATDGGRTVTAIDFNTAAPAAARPDLFPADAAGKVKDQINSHGWLAAGVPGVPAGFQLALDRLGTKRFGEVARPAIRLARDGVAVDRSFAAAAKSTRPHLLKDPASAALLLVNGEPPAIGQVMRNPDLAALLQTLADRNSVDAFYRGDVGRTIAAEFRKHGGLVTEADLAAYQARIVEPLDLSWHGFSVRTPPPSAGGETMLQALAILKALGWDQWDETEPRTLRAKLEALRLVWDDRLKFLGDPEKADVPVARLLGEEHVHRQAAQVEQALRDGKPAPAQTDGLPAGGTIHLSAADAQGNVAAMTFTHGNSFGAAVTVAGLGLTLGHGMSRFDPRPGRVNSVGPGKRPLHNMCPTVVLKDGRAVLAVGARGGRKIPNSVFEVLTRYVGRGATPEAALAAPRLHTEGGMTVTVEAAEREAGVAELKRVGYKVERGAMAAVSFAAVDSAMGAARGGTR